MVAVERRPAPAGPPASETVVARKQFLLAQEEPILDLAMVKLAEDAPPRLLVLEPAQIVLYRAWGENWQVEETFPVAVRLRPPAAAGDPRGRLDIWPEGFTAYLPGVECGGTLGEPITMNCRETPEQGGTWTLRVAPQRMLNAHMPAGRNFFLRPPGNASQLPEGVPPFYSAAILGDDDSVWILAGTDGRTHLYDLDNGSVETFTGWGSEVAAVQSGCGSGGQILATQPGDWTEPDLIRAFEISNGRPVAVSPPVEFPGPVTALWTAADARTALAVARNLQTGRYEAYSLSISCLR